MTTETVMLPVQRPRRLHLDWIFAVFRQPRWVFEQVAASMAPVWLTPLLILTLTAQIDVAASGYLQQIAAQRGEIQLPPDFEYYSPEQQEQILRAFEAASGPVFIYFLPALVRFVAVWTKWLILGMVIHLFLAMLGGRGTTGLTMNAVAWASMPLLIRDLVRAGYMMISRTEITLPGLSGFAPSGDGIWLAALFRLMGSIDLYLILQIVLLGIAARVIGSLSPMRARVAVLLSISVVLGLGALAGAAVAQLTELQVARPFLF